MGIKLSRCIQAQPDWRDSGSGTRDEFRSSGIEFGQRNPYHFRMTDSLHGKPELTTGASSSIGRFVGHISCLSLFLVSSVNAAEPADTNYDEQKVPQYALPPLLPEGTKKDAARTLWEKSRRAEILALFEQHVYGKTPKEAVEIESKLIEESDEALSGAAVRQQVTLTISTAGAEPDSKRSVSLEVLIYAPKHSKEKNAPAFIGLNFYGNQTVHPDPAIRISKQWMRGNASIGIEKNRATEKTRGVYKDRWQAEMLIKRGYGLVTVYCGDIDPDNYQHDFSDGAHPLFYKPGQTEPAGDEWGTISAWAWGLSKVRSWLETEKDGLIDAKRMAVIGHSRLGKTALWAGAQYQNFAMVVSNDSGCGGAALYRRCYGERIHHMLKPVGYWFCKNHATFAQRESELPVDQHMLMALIAPRPLYVASAEKDQWADPKGEFLSAKHASPVYELFGEEGLPADTMPQADKPVAGRIGYHMRSGDHDVTAYDWSQYLDFADKHLRAR
jgi:hypothetical protein